MKKLLFLVSLFWMALAPVTGYGADKDQPVRISVTSFDQKVDRHLLACRHDWTWSYPDQLKTELETSLSETGLLVLERDHIRKMHEDELELPNGDKSSQPARQGFLSAQYSVTGGLTELGICEDEDETGIELGGVLGLLGGPPAEVGGDTRKAVSRVAMAAKLLLVRTGQVLKTFRTKGEAREDDVMGGIRVLGIGFKKSKRRTAPVERASNAALKEMAEQIADYLKSRD